MIRLLSRLRIPVKKQQARRPPSARPRTGRKSGAIPRNDRKIQAPAAVGRVVSSGRSGDRVPTMGARGRSMRLSHVERFATVSPTSSVFAVTSYSLNPGLASIFPWLSDVANRFEKYKFSKISFRYVPQSAALAGLVTLAFDFVRMMTLLTRWQRRPPTMIMSLLQFGMTLFFILSPLERSS